MRRGAFKLEEFEYLSASEDAVLLRVAGHWGRPPERCDLVATTPEERVMLEALPQAPGAGRTWRAAYSAPSDLLEGRVLFHLVTAADTRIPLPQPTERSVGQQPATPRPQAAGLIARRRAARRLARTRRMFGDDLALVLERERAAREGAERAARAERAERERAAAELRDAVRRAAGERDRFLEWIEGNAEQRARLEHALSEQHERLERALTGERERAEQALREERKRAQQLMTEERERAEAELASLRAEVDRAREERSTLVDRADLDDARATAEERLLALRAAGRRLARLRARIDDEVAARTREARDGERKALDEAAQLRNRVAELEGTVGRLVVGIEEGERRLTQAEELGRELRAAIARARSERPATPELGRVRDSVERRLERLARLERQAEALRMAIHERLAAPSDPGQEQLFEAPVERRSPVAV